MDQAACLPATAAFAELSLFISRFASVCWRFFSRFSFLLPSLPVSLPDTWRGVKKRKGPGGTQRFDAESAGVGRRFAVLVEKRSAGLRSAALLSLCKAVGVPGGPPVRTHSVLHLSQWG